MKIACLHTADSNIAVFETAAASLGLPPGILRHTVRTDLAAAAERAGRMTPAISAEASAALEALAAEADAVLLTCSTLGPAVTDAGARTHVPVLRVDAALADKAVKGGGRVVVLCAVETTLEPTRRLFAAAAAKTGADIDIRLVDGAWARFKAGDGEGYFAAIAAAASAAREPGVAAVALAQASMAGAADKVAGDPKPLTSPAAGLASALEMAARRAD